MSGDSRRRGGLPRDGYKVSYEPCLFSFSTLFFILLVYLNPCSMMSSESPERKVVDRSPCGFLASKSLGDGAKWSPCGLILSDSHAYQLWEHLRQNALDHIAGVLAQGERLLILTFGHFFMAGSFLFSLLSTTGIMKSSELFLIEEWTNVY